MLLLIFCTPELTGSVPDRRLLGLEGGRGFSIWPRVSAQIARGGDDREIWLLSAAKWMEVKVQSGSHGVMLSEGWEDKHSLKVGDERG